MQIRSPKIANAKTYTYPRIQLLPYVIRICILHISLRVYSLDSGADNSNYHLDKIVSNLQVLVIKTGKFTKTMSIGLLQMLFGYSFLSSTYLICPSDRYLQFSVTLYNRNRLLHHRLGRLRLLLDFCKFYIGIVCDENEFKS